MPMLKVENLSVRYGPLEAVRGISFEVEEGQIVALIGSNGAGKSTTLKALMGLVEVSAGSIRMQGVDLHTESAASRVSLGLAMSPEGRRLFGRMTVLDNLLVGAHSVKVRSSIDQSLKEIYALFPVLWDMRRRKGGNLSGGQQQQLAISRALVTNPKVLLLDEPTEGIQPSIIKDIAKALNEIRRMRGITIIVSEQVLSFALDVADRLFVIEGGRLVYETAREDTDIDRIKHYLSV